MVLFLTGVSTASVFTYIQGNTPFQYWSQKDQKEQRNLQLDHLGQVVSQLWHSDVSLHWSLSNQCSSKRESNAHNGETRLCKTLQVNSHKIRFELADHLLES